MVPFVRPVQSNGGPPGVKVFVGVRVGVSVGVGVRVLVGVFVKVAVGGAAVAVPGALVGVRVRVIVGVGSGVAGVEVAVGSGTEGRAPAMVLANVSTMVSTAAVSPTVAQPGLASALWKARVKAVSAFARHA
jgi:hypothetical protein